MRYAVVIAKAPSNYAAYVPDLPECIATGASVVEANRGATEFHLEGLKALMDGIPKNGSIEARNRKALSGGYGNWSRHARNAIRRAVSRPYQISNFKSQISI